MSNYDEKPMTTGGWLLTLLVLAIPIVNLVMTIVWACGVGNRNRVTFCRATLVWAFLGLILYLVLIGLGIGATSFMTQA